MTDLGSITIAILITFLGAEIARKLKYPRVIGQLTVSFLLAVPLVKGLFTDTSIEVISVFAELGVIFLLLLTGFELNLHEFKKNKKDAAIIAVFAAIVPFLGGMICMRLFGFGWKAAFTVGACLSVTAEGTKVALLLEMKKIKTRIGNIMLGAGILDDIFEIFFLTAILFLTNKSSGDIHIGAGIVKLLLFALTIFLAFRFVPKWIQKLDQSPSKVPILSSMILLGLSIAVLAEFVGIGAIFGAFLAGIILQKSFFKPKNRETESKNLRLFSFAFIIPFFFINIGMNFDYHALIENPILTGAIFITAIVGKLLGTFLTKPFSSLSFKQLHLIGWGMNSRGVMELVIAHIALLGGLISTEIYSAIVFMAIGTTLIFPFVFKRIIERNPNIMN